MCIIILYFIFVDGKYFLSITSWAFERAEWENMVPFGKMFALLFTSQETFSLSLNFVIMLTDLKLFLAQNQTTVL